MYNGNTYRSCEIGSLNFKCTSSQEPTSGHAGDRMEDGTTRAMKFVLSGTPPSDTGSSSARNKRRTILVWHATSGSDAQTGATKGYTSRLGRECALAIRANQYQDGVLM